MPKLPRTPFPAAVLAAVFMMAPAVQAAPVAMSPLDLNIPAYRLGQTPNSAGQNMILTAAPAMAAAGLAPPHADWIVVAPPPGVRADHRLEVTVKARALTRPVPAAAVGGAESTAR